jgi:UDP-N-acetylmuramate: L-alanyl-gamma-D-glutamyl-meso-diaminopimelate ligase
MLGIAGAAMASLAAMLKDRGYEVRGSDELLHPPSEEILLAHQIQVNLGYRESNLDPEPDLVIIGNALSRGNPEVEAVLDRRIPYRSMPEVLRDVFLQGRKNVVVTGTHGKTTTSTLLAWILHKAAMDPGYLAGGISADFGSTFRLGSGEVFVIEGDEYDCAFFDKRPKFMHYLPHLITVGALEYDHADIYRDLEEIILQFRRMLRIVPKSGAAVINSDDPNTGFILQDAPCEVVSCGIERDDALWKAREVHVHEHGTDFVLQKGGRLLGRVSLRLPGRHNVINALLAIAAADLLGVPPEASVQAASLFRGVKRRLQCLGTVKGVTIYDDFAHHPTAISLVLNTLREMHPGRRLWAVLEPRSHTLRRKVFEDSLPVALSPSQCVIVGPIYRANSIDPKDRLDPRYVVSRLRDLGKEAWYIQHVEEILAALTNGIRPSDVICILSSGPFDGLPQRLISALQGQSGRVIPPKEKPRRDRSP